MHDAARKLTLAAAILIVVARVSAQIDPPDGRNDYQKEQEGYCTAQPMTTARTYTFRTLKIPKPTMRPGTRGWRDPRPGWLRWLPDLWTPGDVREYYKLDDIRYMEKILGRPIPLDQTRRTIRADAEIERAVKREAVDGEANWQRWLAGHPDASAEDRRAAEIRLRIIGTTAIRADRFDWREHGLDLGRVGDQDFSCDTCWAFASMDAVQIARRLAVKRGLMKPFDESLRPSAQQLISCMLPKEKHCGRNWHGAAFDFMMENGLPLGGNEAYSTDESSHVCDATKSVRLLTWGYLSYSPQKISPPDEIKVGVVNYGSVVTMLRFDRCLWLYGDGVFNEEHYGDGSHIVLIVGWDDAKGKNGSWLVKNSYGTEWGNYGYAWIERGANSIGQFSAVVMADPNEKIVDRQSK